MMPTFPSRHNESSHHKTLEIAHAQSFNERQRFVAAHTSLKQTKQRQRNNSNVP